MKLPLTFAAALIAFSLPHTGFAQEADAPQVEKNDKILDSEGRRVGKVYDVREEKDGTRTVLVIYRSKMLSIPESDLTPGEKGFAVNKTRVELSRGM